MAPRSSDSSKRTDVHVVQYGDSGTPGRNKFGDDRDGAVLSISKTDSRAASSALAPEEEESGEEEEVTTSTSASTTQTTTRSPEDVLADEVNAAVEEAEKAADEAVQAVLSTLLSDADGNKSNGSAILGSVTLNVSGRPLQVIAVSVANVEEDETLEVELPSGTASVPGNTLQQLAAAAGTDVVILAASSASPPRNSTNESGLSDAETEVDASSAVILTFRDADGNPIEAGDLAEPIEFSLTSDEEEDDINLVMETVSSETSNVTSSKTKPTTKTKPKATRVCMFWDKKRKVWSRIDLYTVLKAGKKVPGKVVCKTYHLSTFVVGFPSPSFELAFTANAVNDIGGIQYRYSGAAATPNGKAVFAPSLDSPTSDLGVYDIALGSFSTVRTLTNQTWKGAAVVGDLVIFAPSASDAQAVLGIFNSTDETFEEFSIGVIPGNGTLRRFCGAVAAKQELVVFVPDSAYVIGVYNVTGKSYQEVTNGVTQDAFKHGGAAVAGDLMVFPPLGQDYIGLLSIAGNISSWVYETFDISSFGVAGPSKFLDAAAVGNKVIFGPAEGQHIGIFNVVDRTFEVLFVGAQFAGAVALDGKVFFAPESSQQVGVFDVTTGEYSTLDFSLETGASRSAAAFGNTVVFAPDTATSVWTVTVINIKVEVDFRLELDNAT
ncbi:unnamed protein product, partial [Symbiodinium sp. CCMP2456]